MTHYNNTVVCVVTSECTWRNLLRYCFNHAFKAQRHRFHLAVACNGASDSLNEYIDSLNPNYFIQRRNLGFDLAAFDVILKEIPVERYDSFILLHDDHWFDDDLWLDNLSSLAEKNPNVDVFGNLLDCSSDKLVEHFEIVSRILGYGRYMDNPAPVFAQGVAGLFTRRAIDHWLKNDGIPHIHNNLKHVAEICERLASSILYEAGCGFMQIPPGFQRYLHHGNHRSYILEAPRTLYGKSVPDDSPCSLGQERT